MVDGEGDETMQKIYGTVIEFKGTRAPGEPVPGAEVYIEQEPNEEPMAFTNQTKTNSEGYFEVWQKAGEYRITVKAAGYGKVTKVFTVNRGKDQQLAIQMYPGKDVYDVRFGKEQMETTLRPGGSAILKVSVRNTGNATDSYNVSVKGDKLSWMSMGRTRSVDVGGPYSQSVSNLEDNGIADIEINVTVPEDAETGNYTFTLTTRSYWDPQVAEEIPLTINVEPVEDESEEDDENGLPFLGVSSLLFVLFLGGSLRRKRLG
jgi:uncharacterized membrane protein